MTDCYCFTNSMGKLFSKSKSSRDRYRAPEETPGGVGDVAPSFRQYNPVHTEPVTSLAAVSPGVSLSGSKDKTLALFDFATGNVLQTWTGHEREVTKVAYGAKNRSYFSASRDTTVRMWQDNSKESVRQFAGHELVVNGIALNEDSSKLITGSRDNWLKLWDVETGECILDNNTSRNLVTHVCWAKGADLVAQTSEDKELRIWDPKNLSLIHSFPKKDHIQTFCDISADNNYCLSCSNGFSGNGCEATLWDIRYFKVVCEYRGHIETSCAAIFLPEVVGNGRKLIATCSNDTTVRIYDQESRKCLSCIPIPGSGPLTGMAAYDDGSICLSTFNVGVQVLHVTKSNDGEIQLSRKAQF